MIDGRGLHMKSVKATNRSRIQEWIEKNGGTGKTKKDCCEELGITYKTLRTHLREMDKK